MKLLNLLALTTTVVFASCGQGAGTSQTTAASNDIGRSDTLCFERISGLQKQDTASVSMIINGDKVAGHYENIPFEKDARKGTITGSRTRENISGVWVYSQEGIKDSINFEFKLQNDVLLQKPTSYDSNGKEVLTDTASFSLAFQKANCDPGK